jgi:hypothetical protein
VPTSECKRRLSQRGEFGPAVKGAAKMDRGAKGAKAKRGYGQREQRRTGLGC